MIDAHHHLWTYSREEYPWIPPESRLAQDYLLPELGQVASTAGIEGTVVVQARQTLEESEWLLSLAGKSALIRGVVGWVPLVDPSVRQPLERFLGHEKFKGVRHVLQDEADGYFHRDDFHRGLSVLPELGLSFDLLVYQRQLPTAILLVDRQPNLRIIVDHIAKPVIRNGQIDPEWRAGMRELAKRENVTGVKISGLPTEVVDGALDEATFAAYFHEVLSLFGPERLMFGTDWPVCLLRLESYQAWADIARDFVSGLTGDEAGGILHGNASRIYHLQSEPAEPCSNKES